MVIQCVAHNNPMAFATSWNSTSYPISFTLPYASYTANQSAVKRFDTSVTLYSLLIQPVQLEILKPSLAEELITTPSKFSSTPEASPMRKTRFSKTKREMPLQYVGYIYQARPVVHLGGSTSWDKNSRRGGRVPSGKIGPWTSPNQAGFRLVWWADPNTKKHSVYAKPVYTFDRGIAPRARTRSSSPAASE